MTLSEVKAALRQGEWAWPGGYPLYFVTEDGAAMSFKAVRQCFRTVVADYLDMSGMSQWRLAAVAVNWEDPDLYCEQTGERIPSAYAEPE